MDNRRLSVRALSRATRRAESTINQLLSGRIQPKLEILVDLAPALHIPVEDLLVVAGLPVIPTEDLPIQYLPTSEVGQLMAIASQLPTQRQRQLLEYATRMQDESFQPPNGGEV